MHTAHCVQAEGRHALRPAEGAAFALPFARILCFSVGTCLEAHNACVVLPACTRADSRSLQLPRIHTQLAHHSILECRFFPQSIHPVLRVCKRDMRGHPLPFCTDQMFYRLASGRSQEEGGGGHRAGLGYAIIHGRGKKPSVKLVKLALHNAAVPQSVVTVLHTLTSGTVNCEGVCQVLYNNWKKKEGPRHRGAGRGSYVSPPTPSPQPTWAPLAPGKCFGLCVPGQVMFPHFPPFPQFGVNGKRGCSPPDLCMFKMLRTKQGILKCPQNPKKLIPRPPRCSRRMGWGPELN